MHTCLQPDELTVPEMLRLTLSWLKDWPLDDLPLPQTQTLPLRSLRLQLDLTRPLLCFSPSV